MKTATLSQVVAANAGAFEEVMRNAISEWSKTATPEQIRSAFFPERAGVEISVPDADDTDDPSLRSYGEIYIIRMNSAEEFSIMWDTRPTSQGVPFIFHDERTARAMCDTYGIPHSNIVPVDMWKLDR